MKSKNNSVESLSIQQITGREKQVLLHVATGETDYEISKQLFISPNTVQTHRRRLMQKFNAKNSCHLVYFGCKLGLL